MKMVIYTNIVPRQCTRTVRIKDDVPPLTLNCTEYISPDIKGYYNVVQNPDMVDFKYKYPKMERTYIRFAVIVAENPRITWKEIARKYWGKPNCFSSRTEFNELFENGVIKIAGKRGGAWLYEITDAGQRLIQYAKCGGRESFLSIPGMKDIIELYKYCRKFTNESEFKMQCVFEAKGEYLSKDFYDNLNKKINMMDDTAKTYAECVLKNLDNSFHILSFE